MARPPGTWKYPEEEALVREMALLIVSGKVADLNEAARAVEHKASGPRDGDAQRRRLKERYRKNKHALKAWAKARQEPIPPGNLKAAVRSMQKGINYMVLLERIVQQRHEQEQAAAELKREAARIKRAAEQS